MAAGRTGEAVGPTGLCGRGGGRLTRWQLGAPQTQALLAAAAKGFGGRGKRRAGSGDRMVLKRTAATLAHDGNLAIPDVHQRMPRRAAGTRWNEG